jgi:peptidyl-prolyl cis-trans isomerase SurA
MAAAFAMCLAAAAAAEIVDRIVATVNGDIITLSEVEQRVQPYLEKNNISGQAEVDQVTRQILAALVDQTLMIQQAEKLEIEVTPEEVDQAIAGMRRNAGLNEEEFRRQLALDGISMESFREDVRADLYKKRVIREEVASMIAVPDETVDAYLRRQGTLAGGGPAEVLETETSDQRKVALKNIVFELPPGADAQDAEAVMEKAERVYDEIIDGLGFSKAAREYSQAPNAGSGGELGQVAWKDMDRRIAAELTGLSAGEITRPIMVGGSVQIFQVANLIEPEGKRKKRKKDRKPAESPPVPQVSQAERERIRQMLAKEELEAKYAEWVESIRSNAIIEIHY